MRKIGLKDVESPFFRKKIKVPTRILDKYIEQNVTKKPLEMQDSLKNRSFGTRHQVIFLVLPLVVLLRKQSDYEMKNRVDVVKDA